MIKKDTIKEMKSKRKLYRRVDYQVTMIAALILTVSFSCVYFFSYQITHNDMIYSLKERSNSIYEYVDSYVDKSTFKQAEPLTKDDERYIVMKEKLEEVRQATNVRYIYTAAVNDAGEYLYLVDGLPSESSDFRNPGDKIEKEIIPE